MTEAEWLACDDPQAMLESRRGQAHSRKVRLFGVACCRLLSDHFTDDLPQEVVQLAEKLADERADRDSLFTVIKERIRRVLEECQRQYGAMTGLVPELHGLFEREPGASNVACVFLSWRTEGEAYHDTAVLMRCVANRVAGSSGTLLALLRDIFGNPFRPITFNPAWRTSDVLLLAQGIYDERAFERMPILADALQDAGCDSEAILAHCRGEGPHVRGCWVLDLVLGKS